MSKLLWKTLLVSPAVLGVTLVVSVGAVRAVDSTSVSSANELNSKETVQLLTKVMMTLSLVHSEPLSGSRGNHRQKLPNS